MSSSHHASSEHPAVHPFKKSGKRGSCKGNWSPMNIGAMVVGFVLFWPIGLVLLYWNIKGRDVRDLPNAVKQQWSRVFTQGKCSAGASSDNVVFNEYQQTQYDRIHEIKEEINERNQHFQAFRDEAKRREDQEEFDRFMKQPAKGN